MTGQRTNGQRTTARIDGGGLTLAVAGDTGRIPALVYWGPTLKPTVDLDSLARALSVPVAHGGLDEACGPSLFPEAGWGDYGTPALEAFSIDGEFTRRWMTQFSVTAIDAGDGRIVIQAVDRAAALTLRLILELDRETGVLRALTQLTNNGTTPLVVNFLSAPILPVPEDHARLVSWHGRWCAEFTRHEEPWPRSTRIWESRRGRTGHETFPGILSTAETADEQAGSVQGVHLAHNGNWRIIAEDSAPGLRCILAGRLFLPGEMILKPGVTLETPALYAVRERSGINSLSARFHDTVRRSIMPGSTVRSPRPVHFNSWEALYFDLNMPDLLTLVQKAAEAGAERFVVDDGWFKGRDHDRAGLGDWIVDRRKFPDGFHPLIAAVQRHGMEFGLWIEPEMVNPDSDLYRAHPDWVLQNEPYRPMTGRHQLVLDLTRPEVADHVLQQIDALLSEYDIAYLKWDMNRALTLPGHDGAPAAQAQSDSVLRLMARIRQAHPRVDIESCASGGGRIDFATAQQCNRFWLSDNNDAHDRWRIAAEASVFFPPEYFGFHIGPAPSHTSGRMLDMGFRAFAASVGGHMGMELDLRHVNDADMSVLRAATAFHKKWRGLLHDGRLIRLDPTHDYRGRMVLSRDGIRFIVAIAQCRTLDQAWPPAIRLSGLDPDEFYRLRFAAGVPVPSAQARRYESPLLDDTGYVATGRMLMIEGLRLPPVWPDQLFILEGSLVR